MASQKSFVVALVLAILLPGIDRMYLGYGGLGIVKFLYMIIPVVNLVWWIIDIVKIIQGKLVAADGSALAK